MPLKKSVFAAVGLASLLASAPAKADILLTLTSNGSTVQRKFTGNGGGGMFSASGYLLTLATAITNYPGSGGVGTLATTLNLFPVSGLTSIPDLTISVLDVDSQGNPERFTSPTSPFGYSVLNSASLTSSTPTSLQFNGSAQINGLNNVAPVVATLANSTTGLGTNSGVVPASTNGFTLGQTFTLTGVMGSTPLLTVGFNTSVSGLTRPAAVPEPSSLALTGLVSLGLGGVGLRRRRLLRARSN